MVAYAYRRFFDFTRRTARRRRQLCVVTVYLHSVLVAMLQTVKILDQIRQIAEEAGRATLKYYGENLRIQIKEDDSPLTMADLASHTVICEGLKQLDSSIPVISEEADLPDTDKRLRWDRFWLVDPLDGTKEFIKQNGEFTVNIALIEGGIPTHGVVNVPVQNRSYFGASGVGSTILGKGAEPIKITANCSQKESYKVVISRSHPSDNLAAYLKLFSKAETVPVGSSLKMCYVADGTADVYPRFGPTMEWDVAAGDAVFRYATEAADKTNNSPLTYNKATLKNSSFILSAIPPQYLPEVPRE